MMLYKFGHLQTPFGLAFKCSLSDLHTVTTALISIADIITSITYFSLRHDLSGSFSSQFILALLQLTRTVLDVSLDTSERDGGNGICWTAWCQKEFSNQHSSLSFPHSEMILSLYKAIMVIFILSFYLAMLEGNTSS